MRERTRPGGTSREDVRRMAELARLRLSDEELERLHGELDTILGHLDALSELGDAEAAEPAAGTRLRDDEPGADPLQRPPSELAPAWRDGFFTVPRLAAMGGDPTEGGAEGKGGVEGSG